MPMADAARRHGPPRACGPRGDGVDGPQPSTTSNPVVISAVLPSMMLAEQ